MAVGVKVRVRRVLHRIAMGLVRFYYVGLWGMKIGEGSRISLSAKLDLANPDGIHIGKHTALTFRTAVLTHDFVNRRHLDTRIGDYCFIGAGSIIMPGVTIGDHCIVGTGSVVMRDVPSRSVVMGNPARVIEKGIDTGPLGLRLRSTVPETVPAAAGLAPVDEPPMADAP
ncbi:acyltransferase [Polymorphobacter sp.]|uniref:acyltransferase n=1 Tax=Polymorphobacter sp. TaxID=1909290 RepID=UPI003F6FE137